MVLVHQKKFFLEHHMVMIKWSANDSWRERPKDKKEYGCNYRSSVLKFEGSPLEGDLNTGFLEK